MQTIVTILIVLGAVAYLTWQWAPEQLRSALRTRASASPAGSTSEIASRGTCGACSTCGACAKRS